MPTHMSASQLILFDQDWVPAPCSFQILWGQKLGGWRWLCLFRVYVIYEPREDKFTVKDSMSCFMSVKTWRCKSLTVGGSCLFSI